MRPEPPFQLALHAYRGYSVWNAFPAYLADVLRSIGYADVTVIDIPRERRAARRRPRPMPATRSSPSRDRSSVPRHRTSTTISPVTRPTSAGSATPRSKRSRSKPPLPLRMTPPARWTSGRRWTGWSPMTPPSWPSGTTRAAVLVSERVGNVLTRPGLGPVSVSALGPLAARGTASGPSTGTNGRNGRQPGDKPDSFLSIGPRAGARRYGSPQPGQVGPAGVLEGVELLEGVLEVASALLEVGAALVDLARGRTRAGRPDRGARRRGR